ncbi:zona pellucida-like domain-containing protein [Ditylenchus destructor]|nr:zona pellucida-like domain-containing protein [Ditylenchus destructor]
MRNRNRKKSRLFASSYSTFSIFYVFLPFITAIPIDNILTDEPSVTCGADSLSIDFQTQKAFTGRIFVKGYSQDKNCQLTKLPAGGTESYATANDRVNDRVMGFSINFSQCGLRRNREMSGVSITTTVVVSFHPIFITKVDRAYRLNCFYQEARRTVSQDLDVSMLTTKIINKQTSLPTCRYDILTEGPSGSPVKYAKIGDLVYHKWSCDAEIPNLYCMKVHSCTVNDGQGGELVYVLDQTGCEIDGYVLPNLDYTTDLVAGQSAYVFKFADKPTLHFNCQIELTLRDQDAGCVYSQPQCENPAGEYVDQNALSTPPSAQYTTPQLPDPYPTPPAPFGGKGSTIPRVNTDAAIGTAAGNGYEQQTLPGAQYKISENYLTSTPAQSYQGDSRDRESGSSEETSQPNPFGNAGVTLSNSGYNSMSPQPYGAEKGSNYQEETDVFALRPTTQDYQPPKPSSGPSQPYGAAQRIIAKRETKKVADFDLPEKSLVVIEIDENSLGHQQQSSKSQQVRADKVVNNPPCISLGLFVAVFALALLLAASFGGFLLYMLRNNGHIRPAFARKFPL